MKPKNTMKPKSRKSRKEEESDEEISEDGAFNSDDERQYGDIFKPKDGEEDQENEEFDENDYDENGETLLDNIVDSDDEEGPSKVTGRKEEDKDDDEDDEDDGEDDGEEDDDEDDDNDDDEDDEDEDDEEEEDNVDVKGLLESLFEAESKRSKAKAAVARANNSARENKEDATAGAKKTKLTLEAMVNSLSNRPEAGNLKKSLEGIENATKLSEPLPRLQEERAERKVGYENASKKVSEWVHLVQKNRKAEHLSFPMNAPGHAKISTSSMAATFRAETDLELEIENALKASGLADTEKVMEDEQRLLLEVNKLDIEQVKERQNELRKMRALMLYEEQKAKRIKKIKSKMYRKLKKRREAREEEKALEKLKEVDPEAYRALEEKAAMDRARERMTLRHKNTSKYIRGLLKHGGMHNEHTRSAILDQLDQEQQLRRRMKSLNPDDDESDDEGNDGEDTLELQAESLLRGIDRDTAAAEGPGTKQKGLLGLEFMKRGAERQRQKAKENAELLLKAIQSGDMGEDNNEPADLKEPITGRRKFGAAITDANENRTSPDLDTEEDGGEVQRQTTLELESKTTSYINIGSSAKSAAAKRKLFETPSFPQVELSPAPQKSTKKTIPAQLPIASKAESSDDEVDVAQKQQLNKQKKQKIMEHSNSSNTSREEEEEEEDTENPWLRSSSKRNESSRAGDKKAGKKANGNLTEKSVQINVSSAVLGINEKEKTKKSKEMTPEQLEEERKRKEQVKLIRRAFAGTGALRQDFEDEKEEIEKKQEEDKQSKEKKAEKLPGWGSWTGAGITPRKPKRKVEEIAPKQTAQMKRRKDLQSHLIVSEKRLKSSEKYQVSDVPYPFTSRAQYEQSLRNPIGNDWNTSKTFEKAIKPNVLTKSGAIIDPLERPVNDEDDL